MPLCNIVKFVELVNKVMVGDLQRGFPSARVNVGGRSPVVVHKVGNTVHSEPHLPALRQRLLIQQPKSGLNYITVKDKSFFKTNKVTQLTLRIRLKSQRNKTN